MTFQEHMDDVVKRVDGLAGAAIADSDGIIVEENMAPFGVSQNKQVVPANSVQQVSSPFLPTKVSWCCG